MAENAVKGDDDIVEVTYVDGALILRTRKEQEDMDRFLSFLWRWMVKPLILFFLFFVLILWVWYNFL